MTGTWNARLRANRVELMGGSRASLSFPCNERARGRSADQSRLPGRPPRGHPSAVAIERNNSFPLLLSGDELKLLQLLAERDGLDASDYLRMIIRMMPSTNSPTIAQVTRLGATFGQAPPRRQGGSGQTVRG